MIRYLTMPVAVAIVAGTIGAHAQDRTAAAPVTSLKVQVVLSRYDGEKKLASMPYTMLVNAGDRDNRVTLRMGVALPVTGVGANGPTITVHDIGTNMDCTASPTDDGRFRIGLAVNHSSVVRDRSEASSSDDSATGRQCAARSIVHVELLPAPSRSRNRPVDCRDRSGDR